MAAKQLSQIPSYKIVMAGNGTKSPITLQFMHGQFVADYNPTIEDSYRKKVVLDAEEVEVDIIDTAGLDEYSAMRDIYFRSGEGFMCVFNITDALSFQNAPTFREQILRARTVGLDTTSSDPPILLVGAKTDSSDDERRVTKEEAETLAAEWDVPYIEVSAKTGLNVEKVFFDLMRLIRDKKQQETPGKNEKIPNEILKQGPKGLNAYRQASRHGTRPVYRTRIMLVGQERVGKTSLMKSLLGQKYNTTQPITEGVDTTNGCLVPRAKTGTVWQAQRKNISERVQQIQKQYVHSMRLNIAKELQDASKSPGDQVSLSAKSGGKPASKAVKVKENYGLQEKAAAPPDRTSDEHKAKRVTPVSAMIADLPPEILKDIDKELKKHRPEKRLKEDQPSLEFQFWDFAGQDVYYNTHQVFLNQRAIFLLPFDLSKDLNQPAKVARISFDKTCVKESRYHDFTSLEFLDFWLYSIYTYAFPKETAVKTEDAETGGISDPYKSPPVLIIGTRRGDIRKTHGSEDQLQIKAKKDQIFKAIKGKPYEEHVLSTLHCVENNPKNQHKDDKKTIEALRTHIYDIALKEPYMGEQIPIRWLLFEKSLLELAAQNTRHTTLEQATKEGASHGIVDATELLTVLQFLHDLGTIIYFGSKDDKHRDSESLSELVILDPQWLIDIFKTIITVKPNEDQLPAFRERWELLESKGILKESLLDHIWSKHSHLKKNLIALMEKFDLICLQYPDEETSEDEVAYYVPACLQPPKSRLEQEPKEFTDGTFYLDFNEYLPDALFNYITIHAARWSQLKSGIPPKLFYRLGRFTVGNSHNRHSFRLEMRPARPASIKVVVEKKHVYGTGAPPNCESVASPEMCEKVMVFMQNTLQKLTSRWVRGIDYQLSVACVACRDKKKTLHLLPLTLTNDQKEQEVYCEFTEDHIMMSLYWNQLRSSIGNTTVVTNSDIKVVIKQLGRNDLHKLYLELDIRHEDVEKAEYRANTTDVELRAMEVLRHWRQEKGPDATRKAILEALKDCENFDTVEMLEEIWCVAGDAQ